MWNSRPIRIVWHSLSWVTRFAIELAMGVMLLIALSIVLLRYLLLPNIEHFHTKIIAKATQVIGHPVTIEKISADWQGLRPRLTLINLSMLDEQQQPALVLPKVEMRISWLSLLATELRFASLEVDNAEILILRDVAGNFHVGGLAIDPHASSDNQLADWLLHQSRMVVRNALIVWVDQQRDVPALVLQNVSLRLENKLTQHRLALRATPLPELSSPLDIRADFTGDSFNDWTAWRGQIFGELQYADLAAWRNWFDLPRELSKGKGAMRAWVDLAHAKLTKLQVDLAVRDVETKLSDDVPVMRLSQLSGRVNWQNMDSGFELQTQRLKMNLVGGMALPVTDLYVRMSPEKNTINAVRANVLQLETLVTLANFVPIPADLRTQLVAYAPRGKVNNLKLQWQMGDVQSHHFKVQAEVQKMALRQVGRVPGFTGLTADIEGDEHQGSLKIDSQTLAVNAPGYLREPISLDSARAQATWREEAGELNVKFNDVHLINDDIAVKSFGAYRAQKSTPGYLDLTMHFPHVNLTKVARYIPLLALNKSGNDWLNQALTAGTTKDAALRILGELKNFPFVNSKQGQFDLNVPVLGGAIKFAADWPLIESIQGQLNLHANNLEFVAPQAQTLHVALHDVQVKIPDFMQAKLALEIQATGRAATQDFLSYIAESPVKNLTHGATDAMHALGNGELDLHLRFPNLGEPIVQLQGALSLQDNEVELAAGVPLLQAVQGKVQFTEHGFSTDQLSAEIFGSPMQMEIKSLSNGNVSGRFNGTTSVEKLRMSNAQPALRFLQGSATWDAQMMGDKQGVKIQLNSDLKGIASTLPAPLTKLADNSWPTQIDVDLPNASAPHQRIKLIQVKAAINPVLEARATIEKTVAGVKLKQAVVNFSAQGAWPTADGVWVVGRIPELAVQGWQDVYVTPAPLPSHTSSPLSFSGANLVVGKLTGYGYQLDELGIKVEPRSDGLAVQLASDAILGELLWQGAEGSEAVGKLRGTLQKLYWPEKLKNPSASSTEAVDTLAADTAFEPNHLPALDLNIEDLHVSGKKLGQLEIIGNPEVESWKLRRLLLSNPDGSLSADGAWFGGAQPKSNINAQLTLADAGKILDRSGFPGTLKEGSGSLLANLAWAGAPQAFNLATLVGGLHLDTGKGQFLKIDSKAGKLLSVLSLQALTKHLSLDFTDVFSDGFQFDKISGDAEIAHGSMTTKNFLIEGSAAKVTMEGAVDLLQETQNLQLEILPSVGGGVSVLAAFAAGPIVGVTALVLDKILGHPFDKFVSFEYNVTGSWSNPNVTKKGEKIIPIAAPPKPLQGAAPPDASKQL
jgi:uncharacterized protein (TIGR02099 family)